MVERKMEFNIVSRRTEPERSGDRLRERGAMTNGNGKSHIRLRRRMSVPSIAKSGAVPLW